MLFDDAEFSAGLRICDLHMQHTHPVFFGHRHPGGGGNAVAAEGRIGEKLSDTIADQFSVGGIHFTAVGVKHLKTDVADRSRLFRRRSAVGLLRRIVVIGMKAVPILAEIGLYLPGLDL